MSTKITIKNKKVYRGEEEVGTLRNFCCGIDLRIHDKPEALFSIIGKKKVNKCVRTIMSLEIPGAPFHWNFSAETAGNIERLKNYQKELLELDKL